MVGSLPPRERGSNQEKNSLQCSGKPPCVEVKMKLPENTLIAYEKLTQYLLV